MNYAGFLLRWASRFVDGCIVGLACGVLWIPLILPVAFAPPELKGAFIALANGVIYACIFAYQVIPLARGGASLGMRLFRIKAVLENGDPVDTRTAILRACFSVISLLAFGLGFLAMLWSDKKQTWHDRWAGTVVIRKEG